MQVELEAAEEKQEKEKAPDTEPESETPDIHPAEAEGQESPLEVHGDQAQLGGATAGPQQHEERREQEEETHEKLAGESHPSVPADGEGTESLGDSSMHQETLESQESPSTDMSKLAEHKELAMEGEIQVTTGLEEAAEKITQAEELEPGMSPQCEVLSQKLEDPNITQKCTE